MSRKKSRKKRGKEQHKYHYRMKHGRPRYYWAYKSPITGKRSELTSWDEDDLDAKVKAKEKQLDMSEGGQKPFLAYLEAYVRSVRFPTVKINSQNKYLSVLKRIRKYDIANVPIAAVDDVMMRKFYKELWDYSGGRKSYVSDVDILVRPCIAYAADHGDIDWDFMRNRKNVPLPRDSEEVALEKEKAKEEKYYTAAEEAVLLDYLLKQIAEDDNPYDVPYLLFVLQVVYGFRVGEVTGLTWDCFIIRDDGQVDVQVKENYQVISVLQDDGSTKDVPVISTPKSQNSRRKLPVPPWLLDILSAYKVKQQEDCKTLMIPWSDRMPVFPTSTGKRKDSHSVNKSFHRICKRAGIRQLGTHALRHTAMTDWASLDASVSQMQLMSGDTYDVVRKNYLHVTADRERENMQKIFTERFENLGIFDKK